MATSGDSDESTTGANKRESERVPIPGGLRGEVMVFQPMTVREMSRGGAQVETEFPLQPNSLHDFRLALGERSIVVKGRVAYCRISDVGQESVLYRSGVEFIEASDRVKSAIAAFIDAIREGNLT